MPVPEKGRSSKDAVPEGWDPSWGPYDGVEYARRRFSERYIPDGDVLDESARFIRESVGGCLIYDVSEPFRHSPGERHVDLVVVVAEGDPQRLRKRISLGLAGLHIDADVAVVSETQFMKYRDDPNSHSHRACCKGRLLD